MQSLYINKRQEIYPIIFSGSPFATPSSPSLLVPIVIPYPHSPPLPLVPMDEFLSAGAEEIPTLAGLKFTSLDVEAEGVRCLGAAGGVMTVLSGFDQVGEVL